MNKKDERKPKKAKQEVNHLRWVLRIFLLSVSLSAVLSLCSGAALDGAGLVTAVVILLFFVFLGIVFDIIGVAVTSAQEAPFHSMASHREKGASEAIKLLRNAEKVSSICNDVVGDICGIMSGATAAVIVANIASDLGYGGMVFQILLSGLVAGLTIGGKAVGKTIAMNNNTEIVLFCGKIAAGVKRLFFGNKQKRKKN